MGLLGFHAVRNRGGGRNANYEVLGLLWKMGIRNASYSRF